MDAESLQTLHDLVMRWRKRADTWQRVIIDAGGCAPCDGGYEAAGWDAEKLDSDIEMLVRHVEGIQNISTTLHALDEIRKGLLALRLALQQQAEKKDSATPPTASDAEWQAIEAELRALRCNESFLVRYTALRDDYRVAPGSLPLPRGLKCHRQYQAELDLLKSRLQEAESEISSERQHLREAMDRAASEDGSVLQSHKAINNALNTQSQLRSALYHLLMHVEPVDEASFHAQCTALMERRMQCLERKRHAQLLLLSGTAAVEDKAE